jgi:branched-chain amino acid transport system permease protein
MTRDKFLTMLLFLGAVLFPLVINNAYYRHLAILIGIYAIGAISVNLLLGYSGQLSLGHAAFFGVGAYASALFYLDLGVPMWIGIWVGALLAAILGYVVAKLSLQLRGAYFVILTIGVAEIMQLVALNCVDLTKGPMGLTNIAAPVVHLGSVGMIDFGKRLPFYYLVLVFVFLSAYVQYRIVRSSVGRAVVSIRENEDLAESVGINSYKYLVLIVTISAGIAGLSGSLYAHYISFIDPQVFAFFLSVNLVIMVVGGGQGTFLGPVVGAVIFTLLPEWLMVLGNARMAVYAVLVILIVIFMPKGILFYLSRLLSRVSTCDGLKITLDDGHSVIRPVLGAVRRYWFKEKKLE